MPLNSKLEMISPTESDSDLEQCSPEFNQLDVDDEVKSMESKFKEFEFQQIGLTNETIKCMDFWKTIREQPINPATASFKIPDSQPKRKQHCQTHSTDDTNEACECQIWCKALYELQKRNMDKVALATIGNPNLIKPCKYCKSIKSTVEKPVTPDHLSILNKFMNVDSTCRLKTLSKTTQTSFEDWNVRGHPIVDKVRTYTSVYDPTITFFSDEETI